MKAFLACSSLSGHAEARLQIKSMPPLSTSPVPDFEHGGFPLWRYAKTYREVLSKLLMSDWIYGRYSFFTLLFYHLIPSSRDRKKRRKKGKKGCYRKALQVYRSPSRKV